MTPKERFVVLARHFLESFNPKLDKEIVVLDAILAVPDVFIPKSESLRHLAHDFVRACEGLTSDKGYKPHPNLFFDKSFILWLTGWWATNGA